MPTHSDMPTLSINNYHKEAKGMLITRIGFYLRCVLDQYKSALNQRKLVRSGSSPLRNQKFDGGDPLDLILQWKVKLKASTPGVSLDRSKGPSHPWRLGNALGALEFDEVLLQKTK